MESKEVAVPYLMHKSLTDMGKVFNETCAPFVGKITGNRLLKMLICTFMYQVDFQGARGIAHLRQGAFKETGITFVVEACERCGLVVDENFYPVRQVQAGDDFSTCCICGCKQKI